MTYRTDIYAIEMNEDIYGILDEIDEYKYSRIPVYEETIDDIKGILFLKDILKLVSTRKRIQNCRYHERSIFCTRIKTN